VGGGETYLSPGHGPVPFVLFPCMKEPDAVPTTWNGSSGFRGSQGLVFWVQHKGQIRPPGLERGETSGAEL
jgi:hypothetical protein